jgi:tRNA nucleotidyltransferase (CCA-adding enzyme)
MPSRSEWETKLASWIKPASQSEEDKRRRTEKAIADALKAAILPPGMKTYAKGSYANNTNVRLDSDVPIAVEFTRIYYYDLIGDLKTSKAQDAGISAGGPSGPYSGVNGPTELKAHPDR